MINDTVILGCFIWVPLGVWIMSLVQWTVSADIDVLTGLAGIAVAMVLGYVAMAPPVPIVSYISFGLVLCTVVVFPFARMALNQRLLRSIDVDVVERAYGALGQRPDNPYAKYKLAQGVYKLGMIGHAVAIADSVLAYMPDRVFVEERRELKKWKARGVPQETLRPIACVECHQLCDPGWTHCRTCGAPFLLDRAKGRILGGGQGRRLVAIWVGLVGLLAGIPSATALPPAAGILVIVLMLAAAIAIVVLAFREPKGITN